MYKYSLFLILVIFFIPAYAWHGDYSYLICDDKLCLETKQLQVLTESTESSTSVNKKVDSVVPNWFKNNVKWWSEGTLSEEEFLNALEYIVKEKIVEIPDLPEQGSDRGRTVPNWVKDSAGWWAEDTASEGQFLLGVQFLVKNGIIQVV